MAKSADPALDESDVGSRHRAPRPHVSRSGNAECLRCGDTFESWDRRYNRICKRCEGRNRDGGGGLDQR